MAIYLYIIMAFLEKKSTSPPQDPPGSSLSIPSNKELNLSRIPFLEDSSVLAYFCK